MEQLGFFFCKIPRGSNPKRDAICPFRWTSRVEQTYHMLPLQSLAVWYALVCSQALQYLRRRFFGDTRDNRWSIYAWHAANRVSVVLAGFSMLWLPVNLLGLYWVT